PAICYAVFVPFLIAFAFAFACPASKTKNALEKMSEIIFTLYRQSHTQKTADNHRCQRKNMPQVRGQGRKESKRDNSNNKSNQQTHHRCQEIAGGTLAHPAVGHD